MRKMNVFLSTSFICKAQRGQTSNYDADQVVILPQSHPLPPHLQTALWDLLGKRKRPLLSNGEGWADASFLPHAPSLLVMCKGRHCSWWNPAPSSKPTDSGPSVSPRPTVFMEQFCSCHAHLPLLPPLLCHREPWQRAPVPSCFPGFLLVATSLKAPGASASALSCRARSMTAFSLKKVGTFQTHPYRD